MPYAQDADVDPEDLDPSLVEELRVFGNEAVQQWLNGERDQIPESAVELLPDSLQSQVPDDLIATAGDNPGLTLILVCAGIIGIIGFFYGVAKSAFKAAAFFAIVAAVAWYWYANR